VMITRCGSSRLRFSGPLGCSCSLVNSTNDILHQPTRLALHLFHKIFGSSSSSAVHPEVFGSGRCPAFDERHTLSISQKSIIRCCKSSGEGLRSLPRELGQLLVWEWQVPNRTVSNSMSLSMVNALAYSPMGRVSQQ